MSRPSRVGRQSQSSNSKPRKLFALIEWVSDSPNDEQSFTHNVPIDWVQGYDPNQRDESYVVEWRQPPIPKGGWHVYDGCIHEVSDDEEFLKQAMKGKQRSITNNTKNDSSPNFNSPAFKEMLAAAVKEAVSQSKTTPQRPKQNPVVHEPEKVPVGKSLFVERTALSLAKVASTPGKTVGILLRQAFSRRRLIKSTYAGQVRTVNGNKIVKPSLKKYQKMQDIQNFVMERFPYISQGNFGTYVNQFLGEKPNCKRQVIYVSESESEVEEDDF